ncbi:MAG TPA: hypothetical protein VGS07_33120 [Thermoanaerobaculia bacterium]|jgi:hypothetical protein|nr:hypothetical protein [Thermoanaerobaculia bacterium]
MSIPRILSLGALVMSLLSVSAGRAEAGAPEPIAIVYSLTGEASLALPDAPRRSLRLLDRLPSGTVLELGSSSRLALAFVNGLRYELGAGSRVMLGPKGLASYTGPVRPLPRVPLLPALAPIAKDDHPGPSGGAVPIRGEQIDGLYPRRGAAVLAGKAILRFQPVACAGKYRVEVEDRQGNVIFGIETTASEVPLPEDALQPGQHYRWIVRTLDRPGAVARGGADLLTLSKDAAWAREEARKTLEAESSLSLPLLAEIDRALGLWLEAREDLRKAIEIGPADSALREALTAIETRLEDGDDSA